MGLGSKRDGGYFVDKRFINKIEYIITRGLSNDLNFEKDFLNKNNYNYQIKNLDYPSVKRNKDIILKFR
jgi:hypothetical protein